MTTYRIKLTNYFNIYIKKVKNPNTKENYISSFRIIKDLKTIKITEIMKIIFKRLELYGNNNTKNFHLRNLIVFLKWLVLNTTPRQFYDFKEIKLFQEPIAKRQAYTEEELIFLEKELKNYNHFNFYVAWHIILSNALRRSEFCSIDWNKLKQNNFRIQINSAKRGRNKLVRIPDYLLPNIHKFNFNNLPNTLSKWFEKFSEFVKQRNTNFRKPIICHMFKHTAITRAYIKLRGDINKVQVFSGNKNPSMLYNTYIQKDEMFLNEIWEEINF